MKDDHLTNRKKIVHLSTITTISVFTVNRNISIYVYYEIIYFLNII
jgi:hypothetical protein